jgi:hypothetical protein
MYNWLLFGISTLLLCFPMSESDAQVTSEGSKNQIHLSYNFLFVRLKATDIQSTGMGASLKHRRRTVGRGYGLEYRYSMANTLSLSAGLTYFIEFSPTESFQFDNGYLLPGGTGMYFKGIDEYGVFSRAMDFHASISKDLIHTSKHRLSIVAGIGALLWQPEHNEPLLYRIYDPAGPQVIDYGHLELKANQSLHWNGLLTLQYGFPLSDHLLLGYAMTYKYFFQPLYRTNRLELNDENQSVHTFSYNNRGSGIGINLSLGYTF